MATESVKTIRASGGDYSSLSAWEVGERRDLVAADEIAVAEMYDDWPTGLSVNGLEIRSDTNWTSDATRYIHIRAAAGEGFEGDKDVGALVLAAHSTYGSFRFVRTHARVTGIRFKPSTGTRSAFSFYFDNSNYRLLVDRICVDGMSSTSGDMRLESLGATDTVTAYSSLFLNGYRTAAPSSTLDNFLFHNCGAAGHSSYAYIRVKAVNCWEYNTGGFFTSAMGTGSDYNASEDTSAPGSNSIHSYAASTEFENAASYDFHLKSGSNFIGAGANLYPTPQYDIDGDEWPSSGAWDIGFDYVTGGGGAEYNETFSASAASAFTLSDSWALNYAETFAASAASGATFTDTYDTPSVNYDETFASSAASGAELTDAWSLDYSETFAATAASGSTLTDAWLLNYSETLAAGSAAAFTLTDAWSLDYAETFAASAASGCDLAHSYAVGNNYAETFAASSVSVATLTHAYSAQYAETFAAQALADCTLVAAWALDYAETFAASSAADCVLTDAYGTPAPGAFDETFAAAAVSACDLTHAFSTPAAIGRVINPTLAARGAPMRTLKGLKLIN